jgi:hypothetical protein
VNLPVNETPDTEPIEERLDESRISENPDTDDYVFEPLESAPFPFDQYKGNSSLSCEVTPIDSDLNETEIDKSHVVNSWSQLCEKMAFISSMISYDLFPSTKVWESLNLSQEITEIIQQTRSIAKTNAEFDLADKVHHFVFLLRDRMIRYAYIAI